MRARFFRSIVVLPDRFHLNDKSVKQLLPILVQRQAVVEVLLRFGDAACEQPHKTALDLSIRQLWLQLNGLIAICFRPARGKSNGAGKKYGAWLRAIVAV